MAETSIKRKLAAIFSADVKGYSRLMRENEIKTVETLKLYRSIMADLIHKHGGRVVDAPGDNLLAEFSSVVDALSCAVEIQKEHKKRNTDLPVNRKMKFRIGINLGDVIAEGKRIYGDGVNIAARIESLAEPGGIAISRTAYDQVKNKLPLGFAYLGEHSVKNIDEPVRIYRVLSDPKAAGKVIGEKREVGKKWRTLLGAALVLIIASAAVVIWKDRLDREMPSDGKRSFAGSRKPSIAVLSFKNLSGDPEQEYFSDGITNDIITDLSKFRYLLVISGNTTFTYKGKSVSAVAVGRELGARYVLEGSVQKAGDTVRINAQLINSTNNAHVWAERYERDYKDIFEMQGEIVQAIVAQLAIKTFKIEQARAMRKKPQDLKAYDYLLRGYAFFNQRTHASNSKAGETFSKAIALDPYYSAAYAGLGWVESNKVAYGWTEFPDKTLANAYAQGRKALELDESNAAAHSLLARVYAFQNQYELASREAERAIELNPSDSSSYSELGFVLLWSGFVDEAITALEMSLRLDNTSLLNAWWHLGMAYYLKGQYGRALKVLEKGVIKRPNFTGYYIALAATFARMGRSEEAARAADAVRRLDPFFEAESYGTAFRNPAHRKAIVEGFRKAGIR